MTPCATSIFDIGPNLLQVLVQVVTLVGVAYGVTRVLANGKAVQATTAAVVANGHSPGNGVPK